MKHLKLSLLLVALLVATSASARVSIGLHGGANVSGMSGMILYGTPTTPIVGLNGGVLADFGITHTVGIRSGVHFTRKGARHERGPLDYVFRLTYLQVPVHFAYKIDVTQDARIVLHGGPYMAYGIQGREVRNGHPLPDNLIGQGGRFNPFDFGLGIGVGLVYGHFITGIGWDMGLQNISRRSGITARTQNTFLTVGFLF